MKLSKREIILLSLLIVIGILFAEYQFVIKPSLSKMDNLTTEQFELDAQIDKINLSLAVVNNLEQKKVDNLKSINELSAPYINSLKPDSLLLFTRELMLRNGFLPSAYTLSVLTQESLAPSQIDINELTYQLSQLADQYSKALPVTSETTDDEQPAEPGTSSTDVDPNADAVEQMSIDITATSTYEQIISLLDDISAMNRSIIISDIRITYLEEDRLDVSLRLFFIGIKSLVPRNDDLTEWTRPTYDGGLDDPYNNLKPQETTETTLVG